jgi:hypothetical protein
VKFLSTFRKKVSITVYAVSEELPLKWSPGGLYMIVLKNTTHSGVLIFILSFQEPITEAKPHYLYFILILMRK